MERSDIVCKCNCCGTTWRRGEMGDNEQICFRCEYLIDVEAGDPNTNLECDTDEIDEFD